MGQIASLHDPERPPQPPRVSARRSWAVALAVLAMAGAAGAAWHANRTEPADAETATAAIPPPTVTVSRPLHQEIIEWDEYTGQFAPVEYVEIRARVSGYLDSIHFEDGQIVRKGDLLFVIDPRPFEIALAQAKSQLAEATARLELAERQLARAGELRKNDFVAESTYDERAEERRAAAAAVDSARAQVQAAELDLQFTRITAPVSGRIGAHEVSVGNLVTGGSGGNTTRLATIVSLDPIYFNFDVSEANYLAYQRAIADGRLKAVNHGSVAVYAQLPDEKEWPHAGMLDFMDNQIDRTAGTIRLRAVFPNPDFFITPGQFAVVRMPGSEPYKAILVPDEALVTDQSRKLVMTVGEDGTVVPKEVRPGPRELGLRIIREGLAPTDTVIIDGLMRARPGAKVTPQPGRIEPTEPPTG